MNKTPILIIVGLISALIFGVVFSLAFFELGSDVETNSSNFVVFFSVFIDASIFSIIFFILIRAAISAQKRRQNSTTISRIQQPEKQVQAQTSYNQKEEVLKTIKILKLFCEYCGEKMYKDSSFCTRCGSKLKNYD